MTIEITMKFKKSTKGTHVFEEVLTSEHAVYSIPTLYVRKTALTEPVQEIKLTLEVLK